MRKRGHIARVRILMVTAGLTDSRRSDMKRKEFTKQFGCECCRWATKRQQKHIIKAKEKAEWKREWNVR